jgi:hypothetical protein
MTDQAQKPDPSLWYWRDCQGQEQAQVLAAMPRQAPDNPARGMAWHDAETGTICVWDGDDWVCIPKD